MGISPHQVTSNANGRMLAVERIVEDRATPTPERLVSIAAIVEEFRRDVAGSTANPFPRPATVDTLLVVYGRAHNVNTGGATVEWLRSELGLIHSQRRKLERDLAEAEAEARRLRAGRA